MEQSAQHLQQDVGYNWVDVTKEFFESTNEMKLGELLHDEMFGLFEAMSAIEMMDPKMDAGMICNKTGKKMLNLDQAIKCGKIKINNLTYEEQIGIIDDTIGCLVTWLEGHSLAQTVFINLYLHNPSLIQDKCIKAFSVVILKLIDVIKEFVTKASVFEEEDFQPIVYGYNLASEISDSKACSMIREAEDETLKKMKSVLKNVNTTLNTIVNSDHSVNEKNEKSNELEDQEKNEKSNEIIEDQEKNERSNEINDQEKNEHELVSALYARLKFIRLFFQSMNLLKKESICKFQQGKKGLINENFIKDVNKLLQQCDEPLGNWEKTIDLGIQPDASNTTGHRADYPTIMGFEPLINQRLLPPTFPRYTRMKSRKEAVSYLGSLLARLRTACKIYDCDSYHSALEFFNHFSKSTPSCVLSRSILQVLYLPNGCSVFGVIPITDLIRESIKLFIKPPSLCVKSAILSSNSQAKELIDIFMLHCSRPMANLTQICGHNRARQREKLAQILEELAALQEESEKIDSFLTGFTQKSEPSCSHIGFFSTWILYHILRVMIHYLLSGFELELYATHEYPYIFWYLYEFLFGWMVSTLNRASNLIMEQDNLSEQIQQQQKGRNNKKVKQKKRRQKPHQKEILFYQALQQLSNGYYKTIVAFKLEGKLKLPWTGLNTEQIRYDHRFAPFRNVLAPPPVSYSQYRDMTNNRHFQQSSNQLFHLAMKSFDQAKTLLETINDPNEEILAFLKIAKTNLVVTKVLLSGHKTDEKELPTFDFSVHKNFPIIRIYKNNS